MTDSDFPVVEKVVSGLRESRGSLDLIPRRKPEARPTGRVSTEDRRLRIASRSALVVVGIAALAVRLTLISASMPYVGHIDEAEISARAVRVLQTGDFDPHFFEYPSLPIYLGTTGVTVGFLDACRKRKISNSSQIGSVNYPYYEQPTVMYPARALFAILSVLSLVFLGFIAYEVTGFDICLFLAPLLACASTEYLFLSWKYLNVDIVGTFFLMTTILYLLRSYRRLWSSRDSGIAGALCGLSVGCKYTLLPILLPALVTLWLSHPRRKSLQCGLLLSAAILAFLVSTPFALLDFATFVNGVGGALYHYAHGHPGAEGVPGWAQAWFYVGHIAREFGPLSLIFAALGAAYLIYVDAKRGAILLSFPVAHIAYMSLQKVHFVRHVASSYLVFAALLTIGLVASSTTVAKFAATVGSWPFRRRFVGPVIGTLVIGVFLCTLPWNRLASAYDLSPDSRTLAVRWIKTHLATGSTILVPPELGLRTGPLREEFQVEPIDFRRVDRSQWPHGTELYVLLPRYGYDRRKPSGREPAEARNRAVDSLDARVLVEMGSGALSVNYPEPIALGNPSIRVASIDGGP